MTASTNTMKQPARQPAAAPKKVEQVAAPQTEHNRGVLGRLLGYMILAGSGGKFTWAILIEVTAQLALIAIPFFSAMALNEVSTPGGSPAVLAWWSVAGIVAGIVALVLAYFANRLFADLATKALNRLQKDLFGNMQTLSVSFFDRNPVGDLISRVSNDSEAVAAFYESAVSQVIRSIVQIGLVTIIIFWMNWVLAIAALLTVPVLLLAVNIIQRIATPAYAKMQEDLGALTSFQEETISGHKTIINSRRGDWANAQNQALAGNVFDVGSKATFTTLMQTPLTISLNVVQTVIVLVVGALLVVNGSATLGEVLAFTGYAGLLANALSDLASLVDTVQNAGAGGRRVFAIVDEKPTVLDAPTARPFEFKGGYVQFSNVDFSYVKGRKILKHNTFEAQAGQKIGLCGPTGAGKSTIINLLTRYYDIDSGQITIDGQNITLTTQDSLRQQIGVVLQEAFLFTDTVMNNLKYARAGATDEDCIAAAKEANAHEFITNLPQGYETVMTERGANLSQGQRQMLTIARAMVANPKILVLDEATSNVDTRTEQLIQEGLARLMRGKTSFVIAHRLSTIRDSDKILVINAGEIVEQGTHDELMDKQGFYYTLYMSQFKGKAPGGEKATAAFAAS